MKITDYSKILAAATVLSLGLPAFAAEKDKEKSASGEQQSGKATAFDKAWIQMAAASDAAELKLAKAAKEKGQSDQVKQHAERMIQDHTKTSEELKRLAKEANVTVKDEIPEPKKQVVQEIASKSGEEFDRAYMEHEIAAHRMAVAHFQNGAQFLKVPAIQQFAQQTLPTLQQHLSEVDRGGHGQHQTSAPGDRQPAAVGQQRAGQPGATGATGATGTSRSGATGATGSTTGNAGATGTSPSGTGATGNAPAGAGATGTSNPASPR